jgi:N-ethylmaleimide reductase
MTADLFAPVGIAALTLRNRIAMAPMTRSRAAADGTPSPLVAEYYAQRAEAGLIVSEAANISPEAQGFTNTPGIFAPAHVAGWRQVTERMRRAGTAFFLQLWHVGRTAHPDNMAPGLHPVAPSAIRFDRTVVTAAGPKPTVTPRALTTAEVERTVADYARAARVAVEAGCDGVEIHAANGYLPSQFLHESSNRRTDRYGGSIAARARFVIEVSEACAAAIGALRVGIRLTPFSVFNGASSADDAEVYAHLLPELARLRLGYLHVVNAEVSGNQTVTPPEGAVLPDVLGFVRPRWPHALIAAGGYGLARAMADLAAGRADVFAFGRDFIGNPDLVRRLRHGLPLAPREPGAWYGSGAEGYTDYPAWTDREAAQ